MPRLIDLSHPLENGQPSFPLDPELSIRPHNTVAGIGYNLAELSLSTHHGTHLDAPYHFFDDGRTLDQIPLDRFYGPASLIDLAPGGVLPDKTPVTVEMLALYAGLFQPGARLLCRTGWDRTFGRVEFYSDYPSLTLDAARWIASRGISLLGMDTPSPSAEWLECHQILLARGVEIVIVESLANLEQLPPHFTFIGFPLNLAGRDGSPIRAVALLD
jgi:arylformamidase